MPVLFKRKGHGGSYHEKEQGHSLYLLLIHYADNYLKYYKYVRDKRGFSKQDKNLYIAKTRDKTNQKELNCEIFPRKVNEIGPKSNLSLGLSTTTFGSMLQLLYLINCTLKM